MIPLLTVGTVPVYQINGVLAFRAGFEVDGDGAPNAYAPRDASLSPLDYLANAGRPGHWYGLACDPYGEPIVQGPSDPAPGYYVSTTALVDLSRPAGDPRRYVDSTAVPYVSVPPEVRDVGVRLGDLAWVWRASVATGCAAVVADLGPHGRIGEGSIALAKALGINADPRRGGVGSGVCYAIWPGSRSSPPWPRSDVAGAVAALLADAILADALAQWAAA